MIYANCAMTKNIILMISHATHMNINHIAACFKIVNPALYFSSLPAAVTIWNPQYSNTIRAISHNSQSTQFMKDLTVSIMLSPVRPCDAHGVVMPGVTVLPNGSFCAETGATVASHKPNSARALTINALIPRFFMSCL